MRWACLCVRRCRPRRGCSSWGRQSRCCCCRSVWPCRCVRANLPEHCSAWCAACCGITPPGAPWACWHWNCCCSALPWACWCSCTCRALRATLRSSAAAAALLVLSAGLAVLYRMPGYSGAAQPLAVVRAALGGAMMTWCVAGGVSVSCGTFTTIQNRQRRGLNRRRKCG